MVDMRKLLLAPVLASVLFLGGEPQAQAEPVKFQELVTAQVDVDAAAASVVQAVEAIEQVPVREKLLAAAVAQVGAAQDCTDLVQNSLAALGYTQRRDQGGFDYGVQQLAVFGTQIDPSEALPGDIAITGPDNGGHVFIVMDVATNTGVHGGWGGQDNTVIGDGGVPISAHAVYRVG